jgi:hypothetical protein
MRPYQQPGGSPEVSRGSERGQSVPGGATAGSLGGLQVALEHAEQAGLFFLSFVISSPLIIRTLFFP